MPKSRDKQRPPHPSATGVLVRLDPEQLRAVDEIALEMQRAANDGRKVSRAAVLIEALTHYVYDEEEVTHAHID